MGTDTLLMSRDDPAPRFLDALPVILVITLLMGGVGLAWRWAANQELPPRTYHDYHVQRWELIAVEQPDDPRVWATLGGLYEAAGNQRKARSAYDRALEIDPDNVAGLMHSSVMAQHEGDFTLARAYLERAALAMPEGQSHVILYRMGELEEAAGDPERAVEAYEASIAESPTYWNAYFRIAVIEEQAGRYEEALRAAEGAARFNPNDEVVKQVMERIRTAARAASAPATGEEAGL